MVFVRYSLFVIPQRHIHVPANTFHRDKPTGSHPPSVFYSLLITHYSLFIIHLHYSFSCYGPVNG